MNRDELARTLRRARERLRPEDVGLPAGTHRRVAGLRREEVATLAGLSVDYVVRLEQGRGPHPSAQVLGALARALCLDDDDRTVLFELADVAPPRPGGIPMIVRAGVLRLLRRLDEPAMVLSAKSDILAWNPLAAALLGDLSAVPAHERNFAWRRFLDPAHVRVDAAQERLTALQAVGALRQALARYPDDAGLARLLARLRSSEEFRAVWEEAPSGVWRSQRKTVPHPELGPVVLDCDTLLVPDDDQRLVVYSAEPGTPGAQALALLGVIGTQRLSPSGHARP